MERPSRVVFMGTPRFAVPSLGKLVDGKVDVALVVTQPDRPRGRGNKFAAPPVKVCAEGLGIPVYQPEKVGAEEAMERICSEGADCLVVVAYGQILPVSLLGRHRLGALNVHGSLLPAYRGAAPMQRALLAGEAVTGISIMLLDAGMDTGPVLSRAELAIGASDTFGTLHDRMSVLGAEILVETLEKWRVGGLGPEPQDDALATCAPPVRKEELRIDWSLPAVRVFNAIRAFDPIPGAYSVHAGKRLKLFAPALLPWRGQGRPGEILGHTDQGLIVLAGDGHAVAVGEVQAEGRGRLGAGEFLRGRPMVSGACME